MFFSPLEQFDVIWLFSGKLFIAPLLSVLAPLLILFIIIYFIINTILLQD